MVWDGTIEAGKRYVSRSGLEVRIYATDCGGEFPIHGARLLTPGWWESETWTPDGFYMANRDGNTFDIVGPWVDPPEPKWRPFRDDELLGLIGRVVTPVYDVSRFSIVTGVIGGSVTVDGKVLSPDRLFMDWSILQPDGTWKSCGVLETTL